MKALLTILLVPAVVFLGVLLGTTVGACVGWITGLVFDESLAQLAKAMGISGTPPYQLGAIFGFIGAFFRTTVSSKE